MEEIPFVSAQIIVALSIVAGFLCWLLKGLLCTAQYDVGQSRAVLLTGCDTGIGHEVARHLDLLGFHVFAGCLDTSSEGAQRLRVEASSKLKLVNMDVRREDHIKRAKAFIDENLLSNGCNGLWAVINNAGVCVCGEFDWQTMDQMERQIGVNVLGTMRVTKIFLPLLKIGKGRLVNVSSIAGEFGYPGLSVYCASKFAIEGLSQVLRMELNKLGVDVVTIQPGDFSKATNLLTNHHRNMNEMWSEMTDNSREEYKTFFLKYHDTVAKSGFTGSRIKPLATLPDSLLQGFENALLSKVPEKCYTLMPTWDKRFKMILLGFLPSQWTNKILHRRYAMSIPPVNTTYRRRVTVNM